MNILSENEQPLTRAVTGGRILAGTQVRLKSLVLWQ